MDFVADTPSDRRSSRVLNIVDDFSSLGDLTPEAYAQQAGWAA